MSFQPMSEILCNVKSRSAAEAGKRDRSGLGVVAKKQLDRVARLPGSDGPAGGTARGWRWPQSTQPGEGEFLAMFVFFTIIGTFSIW